MDLRSFRVQIASGSLELEVQHDVLLLAESCGCPWLEHLCLERALEDRVGKCPLDLLAARACRLVFAFVYIIFVEQSSVQNIAI